jgi:signal transduction histidine kinase
MPSRCPITNPLFRTRALIVFEALRLLLVLAIIGWWGWLLVDRTQYILSLEGELVMHDASYIPLHEGEKVVTMVAAEAGVLILLVLVSSLFAFWLAVRDIRRTRALQGFFASMAHELRTPLASVRLQVEGIQQQATGNSVKYLERLSEDLSRFEMQLDRGLELARSEGGKALVVSVVDLAEIWRRASPCPILAVTGKPEGKVLADAHALTVIFRNIIENAQLHGKATALDIRVQGAEGRVQVSFADNGVGCAEKHMGKLFAKGTESKGTGVGLYLIQSLMKQMGGSAEFSSGEGFTVTLIFRAAHA